MMLANVALPSFLGHWIVFVILLPVVAFVEAVVLARLLGIKLTEAYVTSAKANWRSTIAGLPAGWCMALAGLIPAGVLAYFLPDAYRNPAFQIIAFTAFTSGIIPNRFSMIAMATGCLILLVPYYIATVRVERRVVESRHPEIDPTRVAIAVRWANRLSYSLLAILVLWWLITAIAEYRLHAEAGGVGNALVVTHRYRVVHAPCSLQARRSRRVGRPKQPHRSAAGSPIHGAFRPMASANPAATG